MERSNEPRARRSVVWHGYLREVVDGVTAREASAWCRLEIGEDGWCRVCGPYGCALFKPDDPARLIAVAEQLLKGEVS